MGKSKFAVLAPVTFFILFATSGIAQFRTDGDLLIPPDYFTMQPPPAGSSYVDPVFGTSVKRVTDAPALGYDAMFHQYSQASPPT